jgi:hypothetical protein
MNRLQPQLRGTAFSIAATAAFFAALAAAPLPASAEVGFHFSPVLTGVLPKSTSFTHQGVEISAKGKLGFGGGALFGTRFSPYWGIEAGTIFLQRNYTESGEFVGIPFSVDVVSQAVHFPLGLRIYLGSLLSLQAGGFYDSSLESDTGSNYGVQAGVRLSLPLTQSIAFFAEGRHHQGLKDQGGIKVSDLAFALVGITFGTLSK